MRKVFTAIVLCLIAMLLPLRAQSKPPVTPPRLISLPSPDCGAGKPCHGSHGRVRLILDVLENGKVGDVRTEIGSNDALVAAATAAAQQAEFVPGSFFGKPVMMDYVLTLHF